MENNAPLHVLVISTWYPNGKDTLIGIYHKHFCQALSQNGVKVNMLHVDRQAISMLPKYPFMKKHYTEECDGYTVYFQRMLNISRISFNLQIRSYVKHLEKMYRRYEAINGKPDVLHAQVTVPAGYAACVLAKKIGVPVVVTEHCSYFERFMTGAEGKYAKYVLDNAARISCVGKYMQDIYAQKYDIHAELLPNIVNCSAYSAPKQKANDGKLHFVTVSALRDGKRIEFAAEALRQLKESGAIGAFDYTVVGDGYYADHYKAAVSEMGMDDCVHFVGRKTTQEIAQILAGSDALLVPSDVETFCIPAIEALSAGVPVVSTRCGGPEGYLNADCSELCDVDDPQSMADAILRLVNRLDDLDENRIRDTAKQFDAASVAEKAKSIYQAVLR